ncbi:MAG: oligogalacturonate lyase [Verrucomicrobia bacterium]|nr:MAG: oligogalacturonate lyase [Verrucomicrobiota bacterium]
MKQRVFSSLTPSLDCRTGQEWCDARPHPDPLPQEREQHLRVLLSRMAVRPNQPQDLSGDCERFSLSLGERAGVRASVPQKSDGRFFRIHLPKTPANRILSLAGHLVMVLIATVFSGCASGDRAAGLTVKPAAKPVPLRDVWIDADTGHCVVRLSRVPGESQSLYFHQNEFTASGDKLVFENTDTRFNSQRTRDDRQFLTNRIYVCDFTTKKSKLLTDHGGKVILVMPQSRTVYHQRSNTLYSTHLDTRATKTLAQLPPRWRVAAINADETLGAGSFLEPDAAQIDVSGPKSSWFNEIFEAARPGGIFLVNLQTGATNVIHRGTNWFNHFQFSPTDPGLLQFCHEGPWHKLDRIWQIRTDGSGLRLMHARTVTNEIAGHEWWSHDGQTVWFDLQMPKGETFFIGGVDVKTGEEIRYELQRDWWSVHYNSSWDGKLFAGDGGDSGMVAHAPDGKWIYLFTPQADGKLKAERLVNMSKHDYDLEPNVQFTPDGKRIVFRANFDGSAQTYAVEVARADVRSLHKR